MYYLRYYCFLPYTEDKNINDIDSIQELLLNLKEKTLKKMYEYKIISTLSTNEKNDIKILCNIFDIKMIKLEDIYIQIKKKKDNKFLINIFDEKDTLEKQFEVTLDFNKKDKIKLNKKIKLFIN